MSSARRAFLPVWTLAIAATASAFVVHVALRGKTLELGYDLGRARQEQVRLREIKRVLELDVASYKTPERVEFVARTLLGMESPAPERMVPMPASQPAAGAHAEGADPPGGGSHGDLAVAGPEGPR
jgi:cell division protein FtsL